MYKLKKSFREKLLDSKDLPQIKPITGRMIKKWGEGTLVIPAPVDVDEIMRLVPEGKLTTINQIRNILAEKYHASIGCPLTTGIFAWIAAHAAEEERKEGEKNITPYWRTLKANGELNEKYPGGIPQQKEHLEKEGFRIIMKGLKHKVFNFEKYLMK